MLKPTLKYWNDGSVKLYFNSVADCSIDSIGAKTYNKKATAPNTYVTDLQTDLIATGYLAGKADGYFGAGTKRAIIRFQRRAKNLYRVKNNGGQAVAADVVSVTYMGKIDGICDIATAKELRLWINSKVRAPLGRFKLTSINGGQLRSDIAALWMSKVTKVKNAGGSIDNPYGDTTRSITFRKSTGGNSLYSLHYTGRAVDLNQSLAGGRNQIYYVVKEDIGSSVFWRIYCKTKLQDGKQGKKILKKSKIKYYSFWGKKEVDLPEAYYIDLTEMLKNSGFIRIKAHSNWKTNPKGTEWWHFHYDKKLQATFQDELELLGFDEATLKKNGWNTDAKLDHKPG